MHVRIHPIFADSFLDSLASLPPTHALSDRKMYTRLEIVLSKDGQVQKMGVVRGSGMTVFDVAALDSVQRASPFGPAPAAIISKDGKVYLHWEFHRDEQYACSTMNARPFLLNNEPVGPLVEPPAPGEPPRKLEDDALPRAPGAIAPSEHGQH
jgi:TonB family protein